MSASSGWTRTRWRRRTSTRTSRRKWSRSATPSFRTSTREQEVEPQVVCQVAACQVVVCQVGLELPLRPVVALDQLLRKSTNSEILLSAEHLAIKHISL